MALETRLEPRLEQRLKLTQELRTSIELLSLTEPELEQRLEKEALENPFLILGEDDGSEPRARFGTDYSVSSEEENPIERHPDAPSVWEYLLWQIRISPYSQEEKALAERLLEYLDDEGFIREEDERIALELEVNTERIAQARRILMGLEPPAVGAQGPVSAMLFELSERGLKNSLAYQILSECERELQESAWQEISSKLSARPEELEEAQKVLKTLHPFPLSRWQEKSESLSTSFSRPDLVLVELSGGEFVVQLYEEGRRRPRYGKPQISWEKLTPQEKKFLNEKLRSARLLSSSLTYRDLTLLRIGEYIIKKQGHILLRGEKEAVPLTMREIAEALGYHESTVSRLMQNKTILTPWGVKELKGFLRHGGVEEYTPQRIQERIQEIVTHEKKSSPLSDEEISLLLKREGISIARRTVAKYRAILGIPGQRERVRAQPISNTEPPQTIPSPENPKKQVQ
jgi:RNA polymerase sigma-54 factor